MWPQRGRPGRLQRREGAEGRGRRGFSRAAARPVGALPAPQPVLPASVQPSPSPSETCLPPSTPRRPQAPPLRGPVWAPTANTHPSLHVLESPAPHQRRGGAGSAGSGPAAPRAVGALGCPLPTAFPSSSRPSGRVCPPPLGSRRHLLPLEGGVATRLDLAKKTRWEETGVERGARRLPAVETATSRGRGHPARVSGGPGGGSQKRCPFWATEASGASVRPRARSLPALRGRHAPLEGQATAHSHQPVGDKADRGRPTLALDSKRDPGS